MRGAPVCRGFLGSALGEELPAAEEVVPGYKKRGDELHGLIADIEDRHAHVHVQVVKAQTYGGEDRKDRELPLAGEAVLVHKDVLHAQDVVEDDGDDEGDGGAGEEVDAHTLH